MLNFRQNNIKRENKKIIISYKKRKVKIRPVKSIAVLNNSASNLTIDNLRYIQKQLNINSNDFNILTFKEKRNNYKVLNGIVASKNIFSTFGEIKSPEIKAFLDKKYDLLLDFTGMNNPFEINLSLQIKANFRVGYMHNLELYDLMLNIEQGNVKTFTEETVKYLKIIGLLE